MTKLLKIFINIAKCYDLLLTDTNRHLSVLLWSLERDSDRQCLSYFATFKKQP